MSSSTQKITKEFVEKRRQELGLNNAGVMVRLEQKKLQNFISGLLSDKNKTDIGFTFHQASLGFVVYNKEEANELMLLWKGLAKQGKILMRECNNREYEVEITKNGTKMMKKIYTFVVQTTDEDAMSICPLSMGLGTLVSGFTYGWTKQENRDAIYNYVKRYVEICQ